ncbi:MAG: hypothetical protein LBK94_02470 [Prevotellaceae bacterium]|jgi:hypothetical protein|nr:hypothetical protein [Prevotellaceae bacterium]
MISKKLWLSGTIFVVEKWDFIARHDLTGFFQVLNIGEIERFFKKPYKWGIG